jgi:hypothetical protein
MAGVQKEKSVLPMGMTLEGQQLVKASSGVDFEPQARTPLRRTCVTAHCNTLHLNLL